MKALPLALFPPVHWWLNALSEDVFLDTKRMYCKQTLRNRFAILTSNGVLSLSIPVNSTGGLPTPLEDIVMADGKWRHEHLHAIRSAYGRAAYYEHYYPQIEALYLHPHTHLHTFSSAAIEIMRPQLNKNAIQLHVNENPNANIDELLTRQLCSTLEPHYAAPEYPSYPQVFSDRFPFQSHLSCIDLLMNKGPQAIDYILFIKNGIDHVRGPL